MRVGRCEGDCGDRRGGHVHRGLCGHALHDDEVRGGAHDEGRGEGVLRDEDLGDGEVPQESREECEGWASAMKAHRHEVQGDGLGALCDHLCHGDQGRGVRWVHVVHGAHHEEGHVFYRDEPKGPRIPGPRRD